MAFEYVFSKIPVHNFYLLALVIMSESPVTKYERYDGGVFQRIHRFYRGTTFQAIILGLVSFTQPGIWDALNSKGISIFLFSRKKDQTDGSTGLGAGGQAEPYVVNAGMRYQPGLQ